MYQRYNKTKPENELFQKGDKAFWRGYLGAVEEVTVLKVVSRPFPYQVRYENGNVNFTHHESLFGYEQLKRRNKINRFLNHENIRG
jgi:hypothetical protein